MSEHALASNAVAMPRTDEDDLEFAVREYARLVYRIAYSTLRNHHDAEDAVQETFVRLFRYRKKLHQVENLKTWVAKIAWRVSVDRRRKSLTGGIRDDQTEKSLATLAQRDSAEELLLRKENSEVLSALIAALPEPLRDAVILTTVHELTVKEIAKVLNASESAVRSRLFRARELMKEKLSEVEGRHDRRE